MSIEKKFEAVNRDRLETIKNAIVLMDKLDSCLEKFDKIAGKMYQQNDFAKEFARLNLLSNDLYDVAEDFRSIVFVRDMDEIETEYDRLLDHLWYDRYMRLKRIENVGLKNHDPEEVKRANKKAKQIKAKYGRDLIADSDFEYGMRNGKLSALRWLFGDEWDKLDT